MMEVPQGPWVPALVAVLISGLVVLGLRRSEGTVVDPREPPVVTPTIPYIGHLLGMLLSGSTYFKSLGSRHRHPIFTLPVCGARTYIVTDPHLAAGVQRAAQTLSFRPIIPTVTRRVLGFDDATIALMASEHSFVQEIQDCVHARLAPGPSLDGLTRAAGTALLACLTADRARWASGAGDGQDFLRWVKGVVTTATAAFLYGPDHPLTDTPALADSFWDFDAGIPRLLVGVVPSCTARTAYRGRETLVAAFRRFRASAGYARAAPLTRERGAIATRHGVTEANIARSDLSFFFAGIVNTSLAAYWLLLNICARPALLQEIRDEIERTLTSSDGSRTVSMKRVARDCPLLVSAFRETLRLYSDNFATRVVQEDTLLQNRWFLQKGAILQVSGGIMHAKPSIWGPDVHAFEPRRFLTKPPHPAAFRAFGGGATLCPGRHFALNEIVGFVAMVVLLFDVRGHNGTQLTLPKKREDVVPIHVLEPRSTLLVDMKQREGWENVAIDVEA